MKPNHCHWDNIRILKALYWSYPTKELLVVVVVLSGRPNLVLVSLGPGLWSLVLGPSGPDLGPDLDLTWVLDLDLSLTIFGGDTLGRHKRDHWTHECDWEEA